MPYIAPYISAAGLIIPPYQDILDALIAKKKAIYGKDIYLGNDSTDYQELANFALMVFDSFQTAQLVYNNRGPLTAIGTGLDQIVKINGIARKEAKYSTCDVVLTGTIGTVIANGKVTDTSGFIWDLPSSIVLISDGGSPESGYAESSVTCETIGAISATSGTINTISTPMAGWLAVTNPTSATEGDAVETDAELRARQAKSTTKPSMTVLTGTYSALASLSNVLRVRVEENPTNKIDANGLPPHSFSCVVEGGDISEIAKTIWENKGIGPLTNPEVQSPDPDNAVHVDVFDILSGVTSTINFQRPILVPIYVEIEIAAYNGYTTATANAIKEQVALYLNSLEIGETVTISALYSVALSVMPSLIKPIFSITSLGIAKGDTSPIIPESANIILEYYEVSTGNISWITIV
jgi:uncharacterized phage protein gp47/JayE